MIEVPIYNQKGDKVDTLQVDEQKLGGEVRTNLLKQALVMYHANQRQGTVKSKGRGEVAASPPAARSWRSSSRTTCSSSTRSRSRPPRRSSSRRCSRRWASTAAYCSP